MYEPTTATEALKMKNRTETLSVTELREHVNLSHFGKVRLGSTIPGSHLLYFMRLLMSSSPLRTRPLNMITLHV